MSKRMRNLVAKEMNVNFRSKTIGGRNERRTDSNRNRFDWRNEIQDDLELDNEFV